MMYPRFAEAQIRAALRATRVVQSAARANPERRPLRGGSRGSGGLFSRWTIRRRAAAKSDPVAFLSGIDRAVIDEVQRAPDLLLAIKQSVDEDPRPGRFLCGRSGSTASTNTRSAVSIA
jgi:hypothetical protein